MCTWSGTCHVPGHQPHSFGTEAMRWIVPKMECCTRSGGYECWPCYMISQGKCSECKSSTTERSFRGWSQLTEIVLHVNWSGDAWNSNSSWAPVRWLLIVSCTWSCKHWWAYERQAVQLRQINAHTWELLGIYGLEVLLYDSNQRLRFNHKVRSNELYDHTSTFSSSTMWSLPWLVLSADVSWMNTINDQQCLWFDPFKHHQIKTVQLFVPKGLNLK
jgi:hypothetical protein